MRGRKSTYVKVLVDTSFLLPALGVRVENRVLRAIQLFRRLDVYYAEASLLEAMWKLLKVAPLEKLGRIAQGIEAIRETYKLATPTLQAYALAFKLYRLGHKDYIDDLLYATASTMGALFLTIDDDFVKFLEKTDMPLDIVVFPEDLANVIGA